MPDAEVCGPSQGDKNAKWLHQRQAGASNLFGSDLWGSDVVVTTSHGVANSLPIAEYAVAGILHFAMGFHRAAIDREAGAFDHRAYRRALAGDIQGAVAIFERFSEGQFRDGGRKEPPFAQCMHEARRENRTSEPQSGSAWRSSGNARGVGTASAVITAADSRPSPVVPRGSHSRT
jgi:hypothetical protein